MDARYGHCKKEQLTNCKHSNVVMEKIKKIIWRDKLSNKEVLSRVGESSCSVKTIWQRKKNWTDLVLRCDKLLKDVLEGRMLTKKRRGRPRTKMLDDLMEKPKPKKVILFFFVVICFF